MGEVVINLGYGSAFSCFSFSDFTDIINHKNLTLSDYNRLIFAKRYISFLIVNERRRSLFKIWYFFIRIFIQVGTLLTPAILSLQLFSSYVIQGTILAWVTWLMMVMVAILHSMVGIFDLDRKLVLYTSATEALQQEIWKYLEMSGEYAEYQESTTHDEMFQLFCGNMERLIHHVTNLESAFLQKNVMQTVSRGSLNLRRGVGSNSNTNSNNNSNNNSKNTWIPIKPPEVSGAMSRVSNMTTPPRSSFESLKHPRKITESMSLDSASLKARMYPGRHDDMTELTSMLKLSPIRKSSAAI
jgi:hypothetical protein